MKEDHGFHWILAGLLIAVLVIEFAVFLGEHPSGYAQAASQSAPTSHLSITASGSAVGVPTQARIYVSVEGRGGTARVATDNLTASLDSMSSALQPLVGENSSMISTDYYNLYNYSGFYYTGYNGYVATEGVSITIPDIDNVSAALGALSSVNGISIQSTYAQLSDSQLVSMRDLALARAVANATSQAEALLPGKNLTASNITIGYVYSPIILPVSASALMSSAGAGGQVPEYFKGTQTLTETVTVRFSYPA